MTTNKKRMALIAILSSIVSVVFAISFFSRSTIKGADAFDPAVVTSVREAVRQKRIERILDAVLHSEYGVAKTHLHELLVARQISIRSNSHSQVILDFSADSSVKSREWSYDLVKDTTGWKIIGYGYRGATAKR